MAYQKFEDTTYLKKLFANTRFKKSYSDFINGLMTRLYKPTGNWGRLLGTEGDYGIINTDIPLDKAPMDDDIRRFYVAVYDNKDPKWSLLNYVNTNIYSFMHVVNTVNYWIDTKQIKDQDYFTFKTDYYVELERLKVILNKTGEFIFMPNHNLNVFWRIMGAIARTTYLGNLAESKTLETLSHLGDVSDVMKSKPGQRIDTHGGVDLSFKLNGIKKVLQCKMYNKVDYIDEQYIFYISAGGWYNVDYFSFVNNKNVYVFETKNNELTYRYREATQSYMFDKSLLKYKLAI